MNLENVRGNIEALEKLLALAEELRRTNPDKWVIAHNDWEAAIKAVRLAASAFADDDSAMSLAIRTANNAAYRLSDSGSARFGAASVGRAPDSSASGKRFCKDLETARRRLQIVRDIGKP
ncbi:hypothetical protein GC197_02860 [bacterium]|nr:hypothetical protein [bacterium]